MSSKPQKEIGRSGRSRTVFFLSGLTLLLVGILLLGATFGGAHISFEQVLGIAIDQLTGWQFGEWQSWQQVVLLQIRIPRLIVGALVGGGLAFAGAVMQGIFRNPMADPGILGISGGGSLGAVIAIACGFGLWSAFAVPVAAFLGAALTGFLVYRVATIGGHTSVLTILLVGIAVGGLASALTSFVLSLSLPNWEIGRQVIYWIMGGLDGKSWLDVSMAAPLILGGCGLLLLYSWDLNVLTMGEEVAMSLGVDVARTRRDMLILVSAVTAASVAVSGVITFVGLLVPHMLRLILGPDHRVLLIASFLGGAILLVGADLLARTVVAPTEIRLGVITALLGAPYFVFLIVRNRLRMEIW